MIKCWSSQWNLFLLDLLQNIWLQNMKNLRVSEWSHHSTSSSWFFFTRLYKSHWCMSYSKSVHINYLQIWSTVLLYFELHFNEPFHFKTITIRQQVLLPLLLRHVNTLEAHYSVNEHGDNGHQMHYSVDLSIFHIFLVCLHCLLEKDNIEGTIPNISITLYVYGSLNCNWV